MISNLLKCPDCDEERDSTAGICETCGGFGTVHVTSELQTKELPTPYYDDEYVTLYCGNSRDLLPLMPADFVLVTDPPYGIGLGHEGATHRDTYDSISDTFEQWRDEVLPVLNLALDLSKRATVFTGPHIHEQRKPDDIGGVFNPAACGSTTWGFKTFLPVLYYGKPPSRGTERRPNSIKCMATSQKNGHPCPKPIEFMRWLVEYATEPDDVIVDPFAGSGRTLRAAKDHQRKCIGIELSEQYCEIAVREMSQEVLPL